MSIFLLDSGGTCTQAKALLTTANQIGYHPRTRNLIFQKNHRGKTARSAQLAGCTVVVRPSAPHNAYKVISSCFRKKINKLNLSESLRMAFIHPMYSLGKNKHDKYVKFHNQVNCHKTSSSPHKDLAARFHER